MAKKDATRSIRTTEDMLGYVGQATVSLDCSFSELTESCWRLAFPILLSNPPLLKTVHLAPLPGQQPSGVRYARSNPTTKEKTMICTVCPTNRHRRAVEARGGW